MKNNSDSENSLKDHNFVTVSDKDLTSSPQLPTKFFNLKHQGIFTSRKSKIKTIRTLKKSFSEDIPSYENDEEEIFLSSLQQQQQQQQQHSSITTDVKLKSRSRLSAAFRSLRGIKSNSNKKSISLASITTSTTTPTITKQLQDNIEKIPEITGNKNLHNSPPKFKQNITNEEFNTKIEYSPTPKKKKSKLSKRFSLNNIKKYHRNNSRKNKNQLEIPKFVSSSTQTSNNIEHNFSPAKESENYCETKNSKSPSRNENPLSLATEPIKFEKVRKIQITLTGKKVEKSRKQNKNQSITKTSFIEDKNNYPIILLQTHSDHINDNKQLNLDNKEKEITDSNDINEGHNDDHDDERSKFNITGSPKDTPPQERAPARPNQSLKQSDNLNQIEILPVTVINTTNINTPTIITTGNFPSSDNTNGRGAIRKTGNYHAKLKRQQSREEYFDSDRLMRREGNLDRGRRFPRPSINSEHLSLPESQQRKQQQQQQQQQKQNIIESGNSIINPNLSGSIANIENQSSLDDIENQPSSSSTPVHTKSDKSKIQFSVGKSVRPRTSSYILSNQITSDSKDYSSIGSNKSSDSQSPISEGSIHRRKIKYIDQATFYTDEERDILSGKREIYSQLSGISEYSLDSEFSIDSTQQMPAFGDLTMDHEEAPIMTTLSSEKREHLYKILVIGELGTGKTSFIKRYVHQFFSQNYRATIGVDFALKVLHWDKNTIVRLQLWDIAGQERFGNMTRVYYKEAVGAFIVFDVTRSGTFDCVNKWKEDLDSKVQLPDGSPIPCILLANKCDQEKQCSISPEKMEEYCKENGFAGWFETSAKDNINIEEAARALVNKILLNDKLISASDIADSDKFALGSGTVTSPSQSKNKCSC